MKDRINMSQKDLDRLEILKSVLNKQITQIEASRLLKISDRQVRKLINRGNCKTSKKRWIRPWTFKTVWSPKKTALFASFAIPSFVKKYNQLFSKKPKSDYDAHRSLEGYDLERILCRKEIRSLNSSAIFQFDKVHYQIQGISEYYRFNKKKVEIRTRKEKMRVFLGGKEVKYFL